MTPLLLSIFAAMLAATSPGHRCLGDSKDALDAKAVICIADPLANPLDGFEPPKVAFPEPIPNVTETEFQR